MAPRRPRGRTRRQRRAAPAAAAAAAPPPPAAAQPLTTTVPVDRRVRVAQVSLPNDLNTPTQVHRYIPYIKQCMEYTHKKEYPSNHSFHEE